MAALKKPVAYLFDVRSQKGEHRVFAALDYVPSCGDAIVKRQDSGQINPVAGLERGLINRFSADYEDLALLIRDLLGFRQSLFKRTMEAY